MVEDYITFEQYSEGEDAVWNIETSDGDCIAKIEYIKVGAWKSWCLTGVDDMHVYFSASCLDSIRNKIKELNGKRFKKNE